MRNTPPTRPRGGKPTREPTPLPQDGHAQAAWFAEGVRAELIELEKQGGAKNYEVLSGAIIESRGPNEAIYRFLLADGMRIPEDATGRLKTSTEEYAATVVGQEADRIHILLKGTSTQRSGIPRGLLVIDDTALLRELAEALEDIADKSQPLGPLTTPVFHPSQADVGYVNLPAKPEYSNMEPLQQRAVQQACGSSVTYIWGPPGTGKTFVIARLVAALLDAGERVLVSSHTNAAVDQSLYELVKSDESDPGPLSDHSLTLDGKILRLGVTAEKIPDTVRLEKVIETKARVLTDEITRLESQAEPLRDQRTRAETDISQWNQLAVLDDELESAEQAAINAEGAVEATEAHVSARKAVLNQKLKALDAARRAWFWRETKTGKAVQALEVATHDLQEAQRSRDATHAARESAARTVRSCEARYTQQQQVCGRLVARSAGQKRVAELNRRLSVIEEQLRQLHGQLAQLEKSIIADARAIFCTLTKNYKAETLDSETFDAVIVDEISMAMPPLIFLAANRARCRVVLVGDFLQLPPIVRSDADLSNERLGRDVFELAGAVLDGRPNKNCRVLTRLDRQHRMVPKIADVARRLVYGPAGGLDDHPNVTTRPPLGWANHLPSNPLVIVDTADLNCWSGKQAGTLSRFNFYSAVLAVELAAMAARNLPKPDTKQRLPIGIIAPYAAQRRLFLKLVNEMGLTPWVAAGTVHTFQGQEAELIIFDSVLDEPYWGARLCNPSDANAVLRELNVAVTRARQKFVFVGSSAWLNKHAKLRSALGKLWDYLKENADLVAANDIVDPPMSEHAETLFDQSIGWTDPKSGGGFTLQLLDEQSFFRYFAEDIRNASHSIFALAAYFGTYRWPKIQPLFSAALTRGVEVTIVTPPPEDANNPSLAAKVMDNLRRLGAVVVTATGLHGKDVIIDERIMYTGSMNWASHRGNIEVVHRIDAPDYAKRCLEMMQSKHIRQAVISADGPPRVCPNCSRPVQVVNQRKQPNRWDKNPLKIVCPKDERCPEGYYAAIDARVPFTERPRCQKDGRTKYRRVRRGRGEVWQCPKHPKKCPTHKVVIGDPG